MKTKKIIYVSLSLFILTSCADLDLNPLSQGSSENWYNDESEIQMSVNTLYTDSYWPQGDTELNTGDMISRNNVTAIEAGTLNGTAGEVITSWENNYKCISKANDAISKISASKGSVPIETLNRYVAEAKFVRASKYSFLISHWGDVPFFTENLKLDEAFTLSRTDKKIILKAIYDDYDYAISKLPVNYGSGVKRATKGAALAMKARIALYMGDWAIARDAAKACIDLNEYQLYADFSSLFLSKTKNTKESIFALPRSVTLGNIFPNPWDYTTRNAGGYSQFGPSWYLFFSFLCTDGLPIDESPLFDPRNPFKNRDPRCAATVVEFQTRHLGFMFQPHPDSLMVMNFMTGKRQANQDSRGVIQWASFNGLVWKKGVDDDWSDDKITDPDKIIIRYADVLLMYAEAKIELNEIDQTVLDAINQVRARAYKVNYTQTSAYPAVTATTQAELRKTIRYERRMEFANEGLRYMDIIRWRIAEKILTRDSYGMLDPIDLREKVIKKGLWFFPGVPEIDDDGIADFEPLYNSGLIKLLAIHNFTSRQYLWPIPDKEILINSNLKQNPGY
ncbi:MAG: RagB/SusD family nutrient uptake outer membrane protein [Prolixibacteraceae bacterium]|jgi:hypothetical protein|nr:RagB/SusD family nutrient uptake outer membrane protein [Prolixibacteraceae bacterium]